MGNFCQLFQVDLRLEDRQAILVSGIGIEKLLTIPKVAQQSTGELIANATMAAIFHQTGSLQNDIVCISFDTTASNTGRLNDACVILERKLEKNLLWLACRGRHNVDEVLYGDVFKAIFGPTSGQRMCCCFVLFHECWPNIDQESYTQHAPITV